MRDACSRIETVKEKIWETPPLRVPSWVLELNERIAKNAGVAFLKPTIRVTRLACDTTFGGRWFPNRNGVGLALNDDRPLTRAVFIHEVAGHWQRWVFAGDEAGEHDEGFYRLMEEMYPLYGVPISIARQVEARPPKSWVDRKSW